MPVTAVAVKADRLGARVGLEPYDENAVSQSCRGDSESPRGGSEADNKVSSGTLDTDKAEGERNKDGDSILSK